MKEHHKRYARAWALWQDATADSQKRILEVEMDSAQNHFSFAEFQEFKKTLDGFQEHWDSHKQELLALL